MATISSDPKVQALATAIAPELAGIDQTRSSVAVQRSLEEPEASLAKQTSAIERITCEELGN